MRKIKKNVLDEIKVFKECLQEHQRLPFEEQRLYRFENDYGASVVCHDFSYGGTDNLCELAVIRWSGEKEWTLTYSTHITDNVIGHLKAEDVEKLLLQIKEL